VSAVDLAHYYGGAGAVAGGLAGVGAGAEADVMTRKTEAYIDQSEAVRAKEAVTVKATAERKIISIVANATGGAGAFTGSAGLGLIKGETRAYLQGSKVETKDLNVTANYKGDFFLAIGAAAVGGTGFSSSLSAALDLSLTEAFVSGSQVMASGKTTVTADTDLVLQHWVVSSAIGLAGGIAGNALVDLAATTTKAYILNSDLGAADQRNGSLAVNARDKIELINRAGALGLTLGNVGIGASANVNAISNTVLAFINHSTIYTTDQQEVTASTERKVDAIGASAGMGLAAGLGGNASLILIGSIFNDANSDIKNELNANGQGTLAEINKLMTGNRLRTGETDGNIRAGDEGEYGVSGVSQAEITRVNQASNVDVIGFLNTVGQSGVSALVQDSTLDAGNDVSITAHSGDQIRINAGAGGIGAVSAGGTAGVVLMKNNLRAEVTGASSVTATGNLVIDARSLNSNGGAPAVQVYSFQGSAGVATLGAAVALADVTNNLTARVGRGTTLNLLNAEGAVMITAVDETNISTKAEGLSVGGATAGLVAAVAKRGGRIEASVAQGGTPGAGTTLMSKGNLILHSSLAGKINAYSQAGTGGAGTVQGTVAEATEESAVTALLGEKLTLEVENASILAEAKPDVKAEAYGYNGGLVASVGTVVANATAKPLVTASIGRNNMIKATDFALTAANLGSALEAIAVAGGGSLGVAANATESKALHQSKVMTLVDASTFMISGQMIDDEMTGGNMNVKALNNMGQKATAGGVTLGGLVAAGGNVAQVKSETETHVKLANGIKGTITGHLAVDATGTDQLSAEAISGSGGIFTGHAAVAGVSKNNRTWVDLGGGGGNDYLTANIITAHAKQETTFNSKVDSTNAAVAGKSGAQAGNTVNSRVEVLIAENARFRTTELFSAQAKSMINKPWLPGDDFNVKVGSGGVIDGSAGASNTALISLAKVIQGKNSRIDSIGIESGDLEEDYGQSKIIGGTVNYNAVNEIVAYDNVRLDTGGAIGIAKTESKITADQVNSEIILDENAVLKAITANLGAQTKASIETSANSKTYGAAGAAAGASLSRLNTVNLVEIGKKALVEAEEINLGAGRDIDGMTNNVQIMAFTDLYNNTAFPVKTDPEAVADAYQNNRIRIADGAKLLGIRDVNLLTTEGYQSVYGRGTGMDLYRAAGEKIANAFRELFGKEKISLKITAGESLYGRNILVYVDGTVQTGVHSKEGLVFDLDGNLVARTERMNYVIDGDYIDVQDTRVVAGGNITINALKLYGKGNLLASGDAEITITNHSRYHLRVNNLIIDGAERGGHLYFNGIAVNSADEIKRINLDQFGLGGVVDLTVVAPGSAVVPRITINNTYTPITGDGPNLDIIGLVSNLSGAINIANAKGNINVAGRILAETVNMSSGKDIFLDYIDGFRHVPSDPMALWDETIKELRAITDELTEFDGTKDPLDLTYYYFCSFMDPKQGSGALIAGNHLYISAEYVNINGTIQSGIPNWNLELDMNGGLYRWLEGKWLGFSVYKSGPLGDYIDHLQRKWEEEGRPALDEHALQHYRLTEHDNKKGGIASYYNPETKEIVVEDVKVEGGKAVIEGKIINTGGGQIKVMDGFGRINIVNNTPYALKLNRLDTGNIEGTLTITDPNITYNGSPLTKVYRRLGNDIIIDTLVQWGDDAKSYSEVLPNSRNANYQPLANQRYYVETLKHGERRRETASWWYGWEGFVEDHPYDWAQKEKDYRYMVTWIREDEETPEFYVLSEEILVTETKYQNKRWVGIENHPGAYYFQFHNGPQSGPYSSDWRAIFDGAQYPDEIGMYLASWVFPDFEERISHSFKADYTIGVEFIGADSGQLSITSGGPVRFSGLASNLKGGITVEAEGGIEQASGKAVLKADQLNLVAKTGQIGSRENPLAVQVTAADGLTALAKNIYIRGVAGDLVLTEVKTDFIDLLLGGGEIRLEAVGNIYGTGNSWVLDGNRIELVSEQGSIGNGPESPLRIKSGDKGLRAAAAYDIYLSQAEGDVYLESVVSTLGDVWLQALNGSFFDANYSERRDLRTEEELLRHWENMRLLGEGAEASAAETIAAYENAKKYEYETYWRFRNIRPVYDEQGQLVDYVADPYKPETASPELQELHILYGETTFDPNWEYKVSAEERAELTEGYLWTREQLETSLNKLVLSKQTTSTVPVFEDPNIRGRNVTLLAEKGSIGSDRGQLVIDANNPVALQEPRRDYRRRRIAGKNPWGSGYN
jgi:hypothetical protein